MLQDRFTFEIKENVAKIESANNGITKEINIISWNDAPPLYDIRTWKNDAAGNKTPYKGISLSEDECRAFTDSLLAHFTN